MTWTDSTAASSTWDQQYEIYVADGYLVDGYFEPDWEDWTDASTVTSTWTTI